MVNNKPKVSYCIAIYNEAPTIHKQIEKLIKGLEQHLGKNKFEIIIVDNGSNDDIRKMLKQVNHKLVRKYYLLEKGHGLALKYAIQKAKNNYVVLTAIDLPFGFSDLINALRVWNKNDIIFGSKAHPKSIIFRPFSRKVASYIYRHFLRIFLKVSVNDTQGSIFLKKKSILPILKYANSPNAFFTAQLAIYGSRNKLKIIEVPVVMDKKFIRKSKYSILFDGKEMFISFFKEYINLLSNKFLLI